MRIKTEEYTKFLYELLIKNKGKKIGPLIYDFLFMIKENGDWDKMNKIIKAFEQYCLKMEKNLTLVEVITSKKMDADVKKIINEYVEKNKTDAKKIELKEKIDSKIIGGVKFKIDDLIIDGSIKTQIINLKNNLIQ